MGRNLSDFLCPSKSFKEGSADSCLSFGGPVLFCIKPVDHHEKRQVLMKRQLLLVLGMALQLAGWFSAFLLNSIPEYRTFYIIVPTLLLGTGMGVALKIVGGKLTALTLALTALTALLTLNQLFPSRGVSISAFQQHLHENGHQGRVVDISSPDPAQIDLSGAVEAFADIEISLLLNCPMHLQ